MASYFLCKNDELPINSSKSFTVDIETGQLELFIVTQDEGVFAYKNQCPHLGIPLNWQPDKFLSNEETHIQCSTHGALFTFEKGYCIVGPCGGESLTSLPLEHRDEEIWLVC